MTQPWPELLRVTLCPDQVVLERGKLVVGRKGSEPCYFAPEIIPVEPRHEPALWAAPLAVLGIALDGLPDLPHDASVILSNHFVHYPSIESSGPATPGISSNEIEPELESALRQILALRNCRLASLQSRLVALGGTFLEELQGETGWVVAVEDGLAAIGLVQDWEFTRFRNLCMWPSFSVELLTRLDREAIQGGIRPYPRTVLLWQRDEADEVILPLKPGWHITRVGDESTNALPCQALPPELSMSGARA